MTPSATCPPVVNAAPADLIKQAAEWLEHAKHPVILAGRVSRDVTAWKQRVALAEAIGARVTTSLKVGAAFPTDHPLHVDAPQNFTKDELTPLLKRGRRHPQPRLGRSRRHLEDARRSAFGQGDPGLARSPAA